MDVGRRFLVRGYVRVGVDCFILEVVFIRLVVLVVWGLRFLVRWEGLGLE